MSDTPAFTLPNFEVLGLLGRGGMASVWKARQLSLDRHVAVKILSSSFATDPEDIRRFREEARAAAQLKHPGIVEVYDANFADGVYYFVMELVDGYTMGELLRRKGRIDEGDALIVAESVAVAMDYAWTHFQMVHCDIKPDNIMADADGTVKITDLGLSRSVAAMKHERSDATDEILGTPAYMSPEQVYGSERLDCRSDIYELGATLYHMVTGRMLFHGRTDDEMLHCHVDRSQAPDPRQFSPGWVSEGFAVLLEKMLAKEPRHRHPDWKWVLTDLNRIRGGYPLLPARLPPCGSSMARDNFQGR
jgi:serine/threonine-protein kinase